MRPDSHKQQASRKYQAAHGGGGASRGRGKKASEPATKEQDRTLEDFIPEADLNVIEADAAAGPTAQRYRRRQVVSNNDRYDRPIVSDNEEDIAANEANATDNGAAATTEFIALLSSSKLPQSTNGGFRFQDEKAWDNLSSERDDQFVLDLQRNDKLLASVPLKRRLKGVPDQYLQELDMFNASLSKTLERPCSPSKPNTIKMVVPLYQDPQSSLEEPPATSAASKLRITQSSTVQVAKVASASSMEDWLDDFLNE